MGLVERLLNSALCRCLVADVKHVDDVLIYPELLGPCKTQLSSVLGVAEVSSFAIGT